MMKPEFTISPPSGHSEKFWIIFTGKSDRKILTFSDDLTAVGEGFKKHPPITAGDHPGVEDGDVAFVGTVADQTMYPSFPSSLGNMKKQWTPRSLKQFMRLSPWQCTIATVSRTHLNRNLK